MKRVLSATTVLILGACGGHTTSPASAPAPAAPAVQQALHLDRPIPYPVFETAPFQRALQRGTRTRTGRPGANYWQQYTRYQIAAELDSATHRLSGTETAWYLNRSPDTLRFVSVQVYNNIFGPAARRNNDVPVTAPVVFTKVMAQGTTLPQGPPNAPAYFMDDTRMLVRLPRPIAPNDSAQFQFAWSFEVPPEGAPRGGRSVDERYFLAYWYPQFAVYDDVNGWQADYYLGNSEFYMGYADYDVSLTVPAGWLVTSTGSLQNADQVLSAGTRGRLAEARRTGAIVHVVDDSSRGAGKATAAGQGGKLTWRFRATNVRDVSWATAPNFLWDATTATTGGPPDTTDIYSFYPPVGRPSFWAETARFGRHSIAFLSRYLWPYPYPHMTMVDGPDSCGGMEYPMMTCIGGTWDSTTMYEVVVHEIGHMWFPMQVGSDEKRFNWMDEGLTQFDQSQAMADFFKGFDDETRNRQSYERWARTGQEVETMRHGDLYPNYGAFGVATYYKTAAALVALREILGRDTFLAAYREYGRRWDGKHPTPYDFFNTFNDVSHRDLSWFWRTWFYETWPLDQAIAEVRTAGDSTEITIDDRGLAPMPVLLAVTRDGGTQQRVTVPVEVWLSGAKRVVVRVGANPRVTRVEIDPQHAFPDLNRDNQVWVAPPAAGH
jgi:hypothetical protein